MCLPFLAQLIVCLRQACLVEAATLAGILAAPMHTIRAAALSPRLACAPCVRYVSLALQCRAAMLRFSLVAEQLDGYAARLARTQAPGVVLLYSPEHDWVRDGVPKRFSRA